MTTMYAIKITQRFAAAHQLRGYQGKCEQLHGHTFKVEIKVKSRQLNKLGMVIDFHQLKKITEQILNDLDHKNLNDLPEFQKLNPTSENIARLIYKKLIQALPKKEVITEEITVWESEDCAATYRPG